MVATVAAPRRQLEPAPRPAIGSRRQSATGAEAAGAASAIAWLSTKPREGGRRADKPSSQPSEATAEMNF